MGARKILDFSSKISFVHTHYALPTVSKGWERIVGLTPSGKRFVQYIVRGRLDVEIEEKAFRLIDKYTLNHHISSATIFSSPDGIQFYRAAYHPMNPNLIVWTLRGPRCKLSLPPQEIAFLRQELLGVSPCPTL